MLVHEIGKGLRIASKHSLCFALGRAPAGQSVREKRRAFLRQEELLAPIALGGSLLDPAPLLHQSSIPAEAGLLEFELLMELRGPGARVRGDRNEDVELARREPHRTQGVVVDPRELPAQQPRPPSEALAPDVARDAAELLGLGCQN